MELVPNTETIVHHQYQHQPDATNPLRFFDWVTPLHVGWNFSAPAGAVPPFLANTAVDQPDIQAMSLAVGVYTDWHRNRMAMTCVGNMVNVNRDCNPMNVPQRGTFELFPR
jgi:hypothetical protein